MSAEVQEISSKRVSRVLPARTALYRHFDGDGKLLYVGISLSPTYRLSQHRDASRWFHRIAEIKVQWFEAREDALSAERDAIKAEKPEFNVIHKDNRLPSFVVEQRRMELTDEWQSRVSSQVHRYDTSYRVQDAAQVIGIPTASVRLACDAGELPSYWYGKKQMVTGWSVLAYMEALEAGLVSVRRPPPRLQAAS